jgi:hypothetical protein
MQNPDDSKKIYKRFSKIFSFGPLFEISIEFRQKSLKN